MDVDLFKGTCQEFGKVFTEDLASLEEIDDKIQHHAEALTNCLKLVQSNPQSLSVRKLWMSLIRSSSKFLLQIDPPPSQSSLKRFVDTIKPWLIDEHFVGLCCKELADMYNLAWKGPWSQPALQKLMTDSETSPEEMAKVFDDGLDCIEYHLRSLYLSSKNTQLLTFGTAALSHPQVGKNKSVQKLFQSYASDIVNEETLVRQMDSFDFEVTVELLNESFLKKSSCYKLCNAALKYLLSQKKMKHLQDVMSCWIKVLQKKHRGAKLFSFLSKNIIESRELVYSVQQCVVLVRALWNVVAEPSRMMCVEILWHALQLLSPDEPDGDQLRKGILSSIAYFLPNSQVSRSCILTIFISSPTVDHYFEVAKTYKMSYDRTNDIAKDCKAHLRLNILEYLQQQWPQEFHPSSSWDWHLLRTVCRKMLSRNDLEVVELEEQDEELEEQDEDLSPAAELPTEDRRSPSVADDVPQGVLGDSSVLPQCLRKRGHGGKEVDISNSESCDCVTCDVDQSTLGVRSSTASQTKRSRSESSKPAGKRASSKKEIPDESWFVCPEEDCHRSYRSKIGMSKHLSKVHNWPIGEIHGFYATVSTPLSKTTRKLLSEKSKKLSESPLREPIQETLDLASSELPSQVHKNIVKKEVSAVADLASDMFPSPSAPLITPDPIQNELQSPRNPDDNEGFHSSEAVMDEPVLSPVSLDLEHSIIPEPTLSLSDSELGARLPVPEQTVAEPSLVLENIQEPVIHSTFPTESVPSLPPIFPTATLVDPPALPAPEEPFEGASIACPVCSRSFKHRHTVQDHIVFRHKIAPEKAAEMAQKAKPEEGLDPNVVPVEDVQSNANETDITCSRGFYWPHVDFIKEPFEENTTQGVSSTSSERLSHECIIMYTLGRLPSSFNAAMTEDFISQWRLTSNRASDPTNPLALSPIAPDVAVLKKPPGGETVPSQSSSPIYSKSPESDLNSLAVEYIVANRAESNKVTTAKLLKQQGAGSSTSAKVAESPTSTRSNFTQTNFKAIARFGKTDHYHNLSVVRNRKLKRTKKDEHPVARTIISGNFVKNRTRTHASQCCQDEMKEFSWPNTGKSAAILSKKRRSSQDAFSKALFSVSDEDSLATTQPKAKRKYDAQTVYNMADLSRDHRADAPSGGRPSFEDALNSATPSSTDRNKTKKKLSKNRDQEEAYHSSQRRSSTSNLFDLGNLKEAAPVQPSKRQKSKKTRSTRSLSTVIKKHVIADVVVKRKEEDSMRQLFPTHDYEELLRHAEQLSSSGQSKLTKASKPSSSAANVATPEVIKPASVTQPSPGPDPNSDVQSNNANIVTSTPLCLSDNGNEIAKKKTAKNASGKRRIDLRRLSSMSKLSTAAPPSQNPDESLFDDPRSASVTTASSSIPDPDIPTPMIDLVSELEPPDPDSTPLAPDVACPICSKSMSSDFALACHMRKRHKIRSRKVFIPGQALESSRDSSSSNCSGKSTMESKNARGPPEGYEACSDPAAFRLARNNPNASDSSCSSDDDAHVLSACAYSADVSAQTGTDKSLSELPPAVSCVLSANVDIPAAVLVHNDETAQDCKEVAAASADRGEVARLVPNFPVSPVRPDPPREIFSVRDKAENESPPRRIEQNQVRNVASACDELKPERRYSRSDIVVVNGRFVCPIVLCCSTYSLRRNLRSHVQKKHPEHYRAIWPATSSNSKPNNKSSSSVRSKLEARDVTDTNDVTSEASSLRPDRASTIDAASTFSFTEMHPKDNNPSGSHADDAIAADRTSSVQLSTPISQETKNQTAESGLVAVPPHESFFITTCVDEKYWCPTEGCASKYQHYRGLKEHCKKRHPQFFLKFAAFFPKPLNSPKPNQDVEIKYFCPVKPCDSKFNGYTNLRRHCKRCHPNYDLHRVFTKYSQFVEVNSEPKRRSSVEIKPQLSVGQENPLRIRFENGRYYCPMENCTSSCKRIKSARRHIRVCHSQAYHLHGRPPLEVQGSEATSSTLAGVSNREVPSRESEALEKNKPDATNSRDVTVRRSAYKEASLQIQLSSVKLASRWTSSEQELMRLYNKRARARVARALSPAQSKFSSLSQWKLRSRAESNDSTDSFEADYDAQLPCWHCQTMFHCRRNLTLHIQHHLRVIDITPYRCGNLGCLYGFKTKDELDRHKLIHKKKLTHVCLFCPNQSRCFGSFRKLLEHEKQHHTNLQVNLERLRKTHCLNSTRIYTKEHLQILEDSRMSEPFLADGHRRNRRMRREGACDQFPPKHDHVRGPSVAVIACDHVIRDEVYCVVDDVVCAVVEFEEICSNAKSVEERSGIVDSATPRKRALKRTETSEEVVVCDKTAAAVGAADRTGGEIVSGTAKSHPRDADAEGSRTALKRHYAVVRESENAIGGAGSDVEFKNMKVARKSQKIAPNSVKIDEEPISNIDNATDPNIINQLGSSNCHVIKQSVPAHASMVELRRVDFSVKKSRPISSSCIFGDPSNESHNDADEDVRNISCVDRLFSAEPTNLLETNESLSSVPTGVARALTPAIPTSPRVTPLHPGALNDRLAPDVFAGSRPLFSGGDDVEVEMAVVHVVHKLVCDVEVEEQASFMRTCGYIPTGVMYFKQKDLPSSCGVALSVYGYNSEAFALLDMTESTPDRHPVSSCYPSIQAYNPDFPHSSSFNPGLSHAAISPNPLLGPLFPFQSNLFPTLNFFPSFGLPITAAAPSDHDLVPLESFDLYSPLLAASAFQVILQTKLYSSSFQQQHPTWKLDADVTCSEICDIQALDRVSRKLFCRHYVIPNPSLRLPRTPLTGICTLYPVMTDVPRHTAFTTVGGEHDQQLMPVNPPTSRSEDLTIYDASLAEAPATSCPPLADVMTSYSPPHLTAAKSPSPDASQHQPSLGHSTPVSDFLVSGDKPQDPMETDLGVTPEPPGDPSGIGDVSIIEPPPEPNFADSSFLDGFMEEIRSENPQKNNKLLQHKPIFHSRGRPMKSFDKPDPRIYQRRSLSEIVAFCDSPSSFDQVKNKPKKDRKSAKNFGSNLDFDCRLPDDFNPIVKVTRAFECLLNRESSSPRSGETATKLSTSNSSPPMHSCMSYQSEETMSTSALLDSVEATISKATKPSLLMDRLLIERNVPSLLSTIALDHCYAAPRSPSRLRPPLVESTLGGAREVEVADYCEEVSIEQPRSPDVSISASESRGSRFECDLNAESNPSAIPDSACAKQSEEVEIESSVTVGVADPVQSASSSVQAETDPSNLIPCLFCSSWFSSISDCKRHFVTAHTRIRKETKPLQTSRSQTTKLVTNAKKRLARHASHRQLKRALLPKNKSPKRDPIPRDPSASHQSFLQSLLPVTSRDDKVSKSLVHIATSISPPPPSAGSLSQRPILPNCSSSRAAASPAITKQNLSLKIPIPPPSDKIPPSSIIAVPLKGLHNPLSTSQLLKGSNIILKDGKFLLAQRPGEVSGGEGTRLYQVPHSVSQAITRRLQEEAERLKVRRIKGLTAKEPTAKSLAVVAPFRSSDSSEMSIVISDEEPERGEAASMSKPRDSGDSMPSLQSVAISSSRALPIPASQIRPFSASQVISIVAGPSLPRLRATFQARDQLGGGSVHADRILSICPTSTPGLQLQPIITKHVCHVMMPRAIAPSAMAFATESQPTVSTVISQSKPRMSVTISPALVKKVPPHTDERNLFSSFSTETPTHTPSFSVETPIHIPKRVFSAPPNSSVISKRMQTTPVVVEVKSSRSVSSSPRVTPRKRRISTDATFFTSPDFPLSEVQVKRGRLIEGALTPDNLLLSEFTPVLSREGAVRSLTTLSNANLSSLHLFQCRCCSSAYPNKYDYKMHMFLVHSLYLCSFKNCNDLLSTEQLMDEHCRLKHGVKNKRSRKQPSKPSQILPAVVPNDDVDATDDPSLENSARVLKNPGSSKLSCDVNQCEKENDVDTVLEDEVSSYDVEDVWDVEVPSAVLNKWHTRLLTKMSSLPGKEFLSLIRFEVRSLVKNVSITCDKFNQLFMRCPLSSCHVYGEEKQSLFDHVLKEHQLSQIMAWIRENDRVRRIKFYNSGCRSLRKQFAYFNLCRSFERWRETLQTVTRSRDAGRLEQQLLDKGNRSCDSYRTDKSYKCRFIECGEMIGGQSNFSRHMISKHSPSRVAWHEEKGRLIPLFNPIVVVSRMSGLMQRAATDLCMYRQSDTSISSSLQAASDEQNSITSLVGQMTCANPPSNSPAKLAGGRESPSKTPLVVLKKLSSVLNSPALE